MAPFQLFRDTNSQWINTWEVSGSGRSLHDVCRYVTVSFPKVARSVTPGGCDTLLSSLLLTCEHDVAQAAADRAGTCSNLLEESMYTIG